jgi:hypothetical protein
MKTLKISAFLLIFIITSIGANAHPYYRYRCAPYHAYGAYYAPAYVYNPYVVYAPNVAYGPYWHHGCRGERFEHRECCHGRGDRRGGYYGRR